MIVLRGRKQRRELCGVGGLDEVADLCRREPGDLILDGLDRRAGEQAEDASQQAAE